MPNKKKNLLAISLLIVFSLLIFWKTLFKGLLPFPGDLLVSFFFPWYSGGWEGYNSWTTSKEFIASDAIRQHIPWRHLAIEQLKLGQWPLWNPYNFAGTPLLANLQTAAFYPLNIFFFILPFTYAWTGYIILQPLLISVFTYLLAREYKLSPLASILPAIAFSSSSFMLMWLEIGVVGHTILWLPLIFYLIEKIHQKLQLRHLLLLLLSSVSVILAGHIQSAVNIFLVASIYWVVLSRNNQNKINLAKPIIGLFIWGSTTFLLTAFQLLPTLELRKLSPLTENFAFEIFKKLQTPWQNLITLLAPDFFGHPASYNFWSEIYGDGTPFFTIAGLAFSVFAVFKLKHWRVRFFAITALLYATYVFPGPIYQLVKVLQIDLFSKTLASRSMFIVIFCLSMLSGFGLDHLLINFHKKNTRSAFLRVLVTIGSFYALILFFVFVGPRIIDFSPELDSDLNVSFRNLFLPSLVFASLVGSFLFATIKPKLKYLFVITLFTSTIAFTFYRTNKTLPFSPPEFFFPDHPIIEQLASDAGINRFTGFNTAKFQKNFATYYSTYQAEGYDSLRVKRFAELMASQETGNIPSIYSKSDSDFIEGDNQNQRNLLNLLGVKYLLDKKDNETLDWNPEPERFPGERVTLAWQGDKFKVYSRDNVLDRIFLVGDYQVVSEPKKIISKIHSPETNLSKTVIIENQLIENLSISPPTSQDTQILDYSPNKITLLTKSDQDSLLFLSDSYYPGWQAFIDNSQVPIHRANYAFRSIALPKGNHQVTFSYHPISFFLGLKISVLSLVALTLLSAYLLKTKTIKF